MSRSSNVTFLKFDGHVLCIEGGGTHSRGAIYSKSVNEVVARAESGMCNPTTNFEAATNSVNEIATKVVAESGIKISDMTIILGCAGLAPDDVRKQYAKEFSNFQNAYAISDGYASLVGCGQGKACGMVVAGTGCAGHRMRPNGTSIQRDGWGWVGADRGSGFWIGLRAIRYALKARDGLFKEDELTALILPKLGKDNAEIAGWFSDFQPCDVAAFARHVFDCAEQGHEFSEELLQRAATKLRELFQVLGCENNEPLFLSGSIANVLCDRIAAKMTNKPTYKPGKALDGCALVAFGAAPLEWS